MRKFIGTRKGHSRPLKFTLDLTLDEAFDKFIEAKQAEGLRPRTIRDYRNYMRFFKAFLSERKIKIDSVNDLTPDIFRKFIRHMQTQIKNDGNSKKNQIGGLSPSTINIRLRAFKTMCRFWHKEGITKNYVFENVKLVRGDKDGAKKDLTDDEINDLLSLLDLSQFSDWRDYILIILLLDTGLRIEEALDLKIRDFDFRNHTLKVSASIAKNRESRVVPVSKKVLREIKELYNESAAYFGNKEHEFEHFVFYNAYGKPLEADSFRKRLNRYKEKLGWDKLHPHMFRHTFITKYLMRGGDVFSLQKIVGHKDISTTKKYVQLDIKHLRKQHHKFSPLTEILGEKNENDS